MYDEILEYLIDEIARITKKDAADLSETTDVKGELAVKSMELAGVCQSVEDEYDVYLKYMEMLHCTTIGEMAKVIENTIEG